MKEGFSVDVLYNPALLPSGCNSDSHLNNTELFRSLTHNLLRDTDRIGDKLSLIESLFHEYIGRVNSLIITEDGYLKFFYISKWFLSTYTIIKETGSKVTSAQETAHYLIVYLVSEFNEYMQSNEGWRVESEVVPYNIWGEQFASLQDYYMGMPLHSLDEEGLSIVDEEANRRAMSRLLSKRSQDYLNYYSSCLGIETDPPLPAAIVELYSLLDNLYLDYVKRLTSVITNSSNSGDVINKCLSWHIASIRLFDGQTLNAEEDERSSLFTFYYDECLPFFIAPFSRFIDKLLLNMDRRYAIGRVYEFLTPVSDESLGKIYDLFLKYCNTKNWKQTDGTILSREAFILAFRTANISPFYKRGVITPLRYAIGRIAPYAEEDWLKAVAMNLGKTKREVSGASGYGQINLKIIQRFPILEKSKR